MLQKLLAALFGSFLNSRRCTRTAAVTIGIALAISAASHAQTPAASQPRTLSFFQQLVGDWIGTCEQTTDGEQAENKYFHARIEQLSEDSFESRFHYYRFDDTTATPIPIGESQITITIGPDGIATSKISGQGTVLVNDEPKNQQHELTEVLQASPTGLQGKPSGKISVSGMPLGLGKNGKVVDGSSAWTLNNGVLNVNQALKIGFRALIFTKHFDLEARYTARRGTDIASLMMKQKQASIIGGQY